MKCPKCGYNPNENLDASKFSFNAARKLWPGKKRGFETEYDGFVYHCEHPLNNMHKIDPADVIDLILPAVENQIRWNQGKDMWWKNFTTWINNRCWEEEPEQGVQDETLQTMKRMVAEGKLE